MAVKIEVGKKYELNNGDVHECVRTNGSVGGTGFGPFVIGSLLYHQDGRFGNEGPDHQYSIKREVLTIEPGKYYRTRDGRKVGPMEEEPDGDFMAEHPDKGGYFTASWKPNGKRWKKEPNLDLIAEWGDETRDPELTSPYGDGNHPLPDVTPETGTLDELKVQHGDVVEMIWNGILDEPYSQTDTIDDNGEFFGRGDDQGHVFRIISRASDTPKTWGEMTDADKGELLLAWQQGKDIEFFGPGGWEQTYCDPTEWDVDAYRIKPEPVRETVTGWRNGHNFHNKPNYGDRTHRITFTTTDGNPDLDSIKMEALV